MKNIQEVNKSKHNQTVEVQENLLKILAEKLEKTKEIFQAAGRMKHYEIFEFIMNENVKHQNKLNIDHFSVEITASNNLISELISLGEVNICNDIMTNYLNTEFKYTEKKIDAMHVACMSGNIEMIKLFINLNHNESNSLSSIVNLRDERGLNYLFYVISGSVLSDRTENIPKVIAIIDYFCELGVNLNAKDIRGRSIIEIILEIVNSQKKMDAVSKEVVRHLVKKGGSFKEIPGVRVEKLFADLGETAELRILEGLVAQRFFSEVKKKKIDSSQFQVMLHDNHMPLDASDDKGCNMLHYAAHRGHMNILPLVMGKNINKRDNYGMSPMLYAIKNNKIEAVSFLMEAGATIFTMNIYNEGMMHYAASNNQVEMMEKIMNIDSRSLTMRSNKGYLPIHKAARSGSLEAIEFLLKAGQDINAVTKNGDTALHIAAEEEHEELFRYLINKGAATDVRNRAGRLSGEVPVFEDVEESLEISQPLYINNTNDGKKHISKNFSK